MHIYTGRAESISDGPAGNRPGVCCAGGIGTIIVGTVRAKRRNTVYIRSRQRIHLDLYFQAVAAIALIGNYEFSHIVSCYTIAVRGVLQCGKAPVAESPEPGGNS